MIRDSVHEDEFTIRFYVDVADRPSRAEVAGPRGSGCRGYSSAGEMGLSQAGNARCPFESRSSYRHSRNRVCHSRTTAWLCVAVTCKSACETCLSARGERLLSDCEIRVSASR